MAIQSYEVAYSTDKVNYTALTNVQSVNLRLGREALVDNYSASTGTVVLRYPTGFASPIAALVSGTWIRIKNTTTGRTQWIARINDVEVSYDIPYKSGVGNGDYVTLQLEGALAAWARANGNNYSMLSNPVDAQADFAQAQTNLSMFKSFGGVGVPAVLGASTVTTSWADWINKTNATINGRIFDNNGALWWNGTYQIDPSTINFSDTTNNATNQVYDQINYESLGQNFFTQVTISPEGLAAQVASSGSAPYRNLGLATFNGSTGQALDLANYLLNNYKTPVNSISSISCLANAQSSMQLDALGTSTGANLWSCISKRVSVTFRGQTVYGVIEGVSLSATPESARYTFYLSPADLNAYLLLNDTVFGRLDFNKLGY